MAVIWYTFAFLLSLAITRLLCSHVHKILKLDMPTQRSSHVRPTPRGGGLAIILSFYLAGYGMAVTGIIPFSLYYIVGAPALLVAVIGFADDAWTVRPLLRLFVHCAAAALFLYFFANRMGYSWPALNSPAVLGGYLVAVLGLAWCINLNNFMDGIDGIAAVEAICVAGGAALVLWLGGGDKHFVNLLLLLAAAVPGFLVYNWTPAKIFMGDACSGFLGFLIGVLALVTSADGAMNVWSWLILYGVFVVDATYTLVRRIAGGARFYEAHRSHAYQILARKLRSHEKVTLAVLIINMGWLFPLALTASTYSNLSVYCLAGAYLPLLFTAWSAGAGTARE